jgi:pyrimidine operon attenuation protein/uracil phosphoribosyltransferase
MDIGDVQRAIWRLAHEVIEHNRGAERLALIGLQSGGSWIASALAKVIRDVTGVEVPVGTLDVAYYRDDIDMRPVLPVLPTDVPFAVDGAVVVLCDDVLYTGRTVRAALDALLDFGRPAAVQLLVMVDRGHRELPIRPDFVGKNLPTSRREVVDVSPSGVLVGEMAGAEVAGAEVAGAEVAGAEVAGAEVAGAEVAGAEVAGAEIVGEMAEK